MIYLRLFWHLLLIMLFVWAIALLGILCLILTKRGV